MPTFATPEPIEVTADASCAQVRLAASKRADTVVRVEPANQANRSDVKAAARTKADFSAGRLMVKTPSAGGLNGTSKGSSVIVTIELPAGSSLVAKLAQAEVHADGALGACDVRVAQGLVRLDRVSTLQAQTADGDLVIGHITGAADINGSSGAVQISEADGTVRFRSSEGRIWIGDAWDDLDLSTVNGGIELDRTDGNVNAKTGNGPIRVSRLTHGQAHLMNSEGNIEIGITEGSAAWVDANSTTGSVRNSLPAHENPDDFDNTVTVRARTRSGDIIIGRAPGENAPAGD
jgi:hypothetical protein